MAAQQHQLPPVADDLVMASPDTVPSSPEFSSGANSSADSLVSLTTPPSPLSPESLTQAVADSFVFAFDIDGVLVRGGRALPEAIEAMNVLNGQNEFGMKM